MNVSAVFIHRPVATALLTIAVALAGAVAFGSLPVAPLPEVDFPTIQVSANLPGASPEIMASSVATPLERQFGRIAGITEMTSSSFLGNTNIALQFDLNRNVDGAARDVQAAINAARSFLPSNLPSNPTYRKVNPADAPIMAIALTSTIYDRGRLYDAASTVLSQRLSQIEGVGQVTLGGTALRAVRVEVNPTKLNAYGLGLPDVASMLRGQNANLPKGQIADGSFTADILANDQLLTADQYKPLVVGYHNGAAVKLSDVADVIDSVQNVRAAGWVNGRVDCLININRSPGANIIDTVERIREILPALKASVPSGIDFTITLDRTATIRASIFEIERTLAISIGLVIMVVFIFLRNVRATLIPGVAVPVSLISTFGILYLCHYSIDNLSLMALTIATGFVVDDAIVVIENVSRYIEHGMRPLQATLRGAREIGFTVLTMSTSLIAVFIPILLMQGIVGRLFREFAVTLSVAIFISLLVSLTLSPMMCSRLLKDKQSQRHGKLYETSEKLFNGLIHSYERSLNWVLRHQALTLAILLITVATNIYLLIIVPKGFFPQQDNGTISGGIRASQDISYQAMEKIGQYFANVIRADPAVEFANVFIGGGGSINTGNVNVGLKPVAKRNLSSSQVIDRLRPKLVGTPGARVFLQAGQDVRIGARGGNSQFQYTIQSDDVQDLVKWGPIVWAQMQKLPELTDVDSDQQNSGLRASLVYDRQTAARMGITPQMIDNTLYQAFGQAPVSTMYEQLNQYYVVMEVAPQFWQSPEALKDIYVHPPTGGVVPLSAISHYELTTAPLAVNHQGQFPAVTVSFNLSPGVALSEASSAIQKMEERIGMPDSIHGMFAGTMQAYQESLNTEPLLIITALLAVYIVLGILYESYIHPITILSTIPSAGVGAVLALMIFHLDLSVMALIGIILLIGLVKKNAILMIDFAIAAVRNEGKSARDAIFQACLLRFRPILMTTMAAMLGALPLALGRGTGWELRRPLGITIVGGLLFSQVLTLYTTPVVYLYMERFGVWWQRSHKRYRIVAPQEAD
jgi:multidrug efflux pump